MDRYLPYLNEHQRRWARFGGLVVAVLLVLWLCQLMYSVLTLLAASFALAYIANPLVSWFERRGWSRLMVIVVLYVLLFLGAAVGGVALVAATIGQLIEFFQNVPHYAAELYNWIGEHYPALIRTSTDLEAADVRQALRDWMQEKELFSWGGVTRAGGLLMGVTWGLTVAVLIPTFTFFFLWQWEAMLRGVRELLPAGYRPTVVHIVKTIDEKTAEFFRGRVVTSVIVGLLTGIGWVFVAVPYSLPLALAVAVLNIVPFLSLVVLPPAMLAVYYEHAAAGGTAWLLPMLLMIGVYALVQGLESFVIYPYLSAQTSGLHPVTTLVVLMVGWDLAGMLGMLLSIPVASTLKALAIHYVLPEVRRLAADDAPNSGAPPGDAAAQEGYPDAATD